MQLAQSPVQEDQLTVIAKSDSTLLHPELHAIKLLHDLDEEYRAYLEDFWKMLNWRDFNHLGVARLDETAVLIKERSCPKSSERISTTARAGKHE